MKKRLLFFFYTCFFSTYLLAQTPDTKKEDTPGFDISLAAGIHAPLGDLSTSHLLGISLDASPARHTFGLVNSKKIAFTYNAGVSFYLGDLAMVGGYPYKYKTFTFIHGFGGLLYHPVRKLSAKILAGPALGIYKKDTRFNIGARLESSYYIIGDFSAGPVLNMMLEPGTDPLWSAGLKLIMDL